MLIDALIVDHYEIKKFLKVMKQKKKTKTKRSYVGEILQCNSEPFNVLGLNRAWLRKVHGTVVWQDAVELGLNVKET